MYVLVQHDIADPAAFWSTADQVQTTPPSVTLLHTFPRQDGAKAVCLWEAESVDAVRAFLEPAVGAVSRNEYFEVPNREGVAFPRIAQRAAAPA